MKIVKNISKEIIRIAAIAIFIVGVNSAIAANQKTTSTDGTTPATPAPASAFNTGDIISKDTLNNMKIDWNNITNAPTLSQTTTDSTDGSANVTGAGWTTVTSLNIDNIANTGNSGIVFIYGVNTHNAVLMATATRQKNSLIWKIAGSMSTTSGGILSGDNNIINGEHSINISNNGSDSINIQSKSSNATAYISATGISF